MGPKRNGGKKKKEIDWDNSEEVLGPQNSQLYKDGFDLLSVLKHPAAQSILSSKNGSQITEFLACDNPRQVINEFKADGAAGKHDAEWLRQALEASKKRAVGFYDEYLEAKFQEQWVYPGESEYFTDSEVEDASKISSKVEPSDGYAIDDNALFCNFLNGSGCGKLPDKPTNSRRKSSPGSGLDEGDMLETGSTFSFTESPANRKRSPTPAYDPEDMCDLSSELSFLSRSPSPTEGFHNSFDDERPKSSRATPRKASKSSINGSPMTLYSPQAFKEEPPITRNTPKKVPKSATKSSPMIIDSSKVSDVEDKDDKDDKDDIPLPRTKRQKTDTPSADSLASKASTTREDSPAYSSPVQ